MINLMHKATKNRRKNFLSIRVNMINNEYNNNVFLNCPETGIYMFDIFGTFSKLIPLKNIKQLQVDENIFYYATDSGFCSYNFNIMHFNILIAGNP
jgi:hypothetical protein